MDAYTIPSLNTFFEYLPRFIYYSDTFKSRQGNRNVFEQSNKRQAIDNWSFLLPPFTTKEGRLQTKGPVACDWSRLSGAPILSNVFLLMQIMKANARRKAVSPRYDVD
ncbi:hypothetical protein CEXT_162871 [Caerostris extrusa]|uniref:Uncharacterized protein n=1 Tax=Caerostris extrusa TaxID=172846 RepID=A0AAV4SN51_CAEEX|nr:hypothetical protein CEXT_162871 [Caerostris extrusa]